MAKADVMNLFEREIEQTQEELERVDKAEQACVEKKQLLSARLEAFQEGLKFVDEGYRLVGKDSEEEAA